MQDTAGCFIFNTSKKMEHLISRFQDIEKVSQVLVRAECVRYVLLNAVAAINTVRSLSLFGSTTFVDKKCGGYKFQGIKFCWGAGTEQSVCAIGKRVLPLAYAILQPLNFHLLKSQYLLKKFTS